MMVSKNAPPDDSTGGPVADGRQGRFSHQFVSGDWSTRAVLAVLVKRLAERGLSSDDIATVELILAEVLNNVTEHAYAETPGPVEIELELKPAGLACKVADQGTPLPQGELPDHPPPTIEPPDHLPEGGFGWHIIRGLTTDLVYSRDEGWNRLSMTVPYTTAE